MPYELLSSPIKVTAKKQHFAGASAGGGLVFEGTTGGDDALTCETASGTVRITHLTKDESGKTHSVFDGAGRQLAIIERHTFRQWQITLPSGESFPVTGSKRLTGYGCKIGDLAVGKAPYLAPQRYFTLTLSDQLLARPDRVELAVVAAWIAQERISSAISSSVYAGG